MLRQSDSTSSEISSYSENKICRLNRKTNKSYTQFNLQKKNDLLKQDKSLQNRGNISLSRCTNSETNLESCSTEHESSSEIYSSANESIGDNINKNNTHCGVTQCQSVTEAATATIETAPINTSPTVVLGTISSQSDSKVLNPKSIRAIQEQPPNSRRPASCRGPSNKGCISNSKHKPHDGCRNCRSRNDGSGREGRISAVRKSKSCTVECDVLDPNYKPPSPRESSDDLFFFYDLHTSQLTTNSEDSSDYSIGFIFRDSEDDTLAITGYYDNEEENVDDDGDTFLLEPDRFDNSGVFKSLESISETSLDLDSIGGMSLEFQNGRDEYGRDKMSTSNQTCIDSVSSSDKQNCGRGSDSFLPDFNQDGVVISDYGNEKFIKDTHISGNSYHEQNASLYDKQDESVASITSMHSSRSKPGATNEPNDDLMIKNEYSMVYVAPKLGENKDSQMEIARTTSSISTTFETNKRHICSESTSLESKDEYFNMEEVVINYTESLGLHSPVKDLNSNMDRVEFYGDKDRTTDKIACENDQKQDRIRRTPFPQEILEAIQKAVANGDFQDVSCVEVDSDGVVMNEVKGSAKTDEYHLFQTNSFSEIAHDGEQENNTAISSNALFCQSFENHKESGVSRCMVNNEFILGATSEEPEMLVDEQKIVSPTSKQNTYVVANVTQEMELSIENKSTFSPGIGCHENLQCTSSGYSNSVIEVCANQLGTNNDKVGENMTSQLGRNKHECLQNELDNQEWADTMNVPEKHEIDSYAEHVFCKELGINEVPRYVADNKPPRYFKTDILNFSETLTSSIAASDDNSNPDTINSYGLASSRAPKHTNKKFKVKKPRKKSTFLNPDSSRSDLEQPMKSKGKTKFLSLLLNMMDDEKSDSTPDVLKHTKSVKVNADVKKLDSEDNENNEARFPRGVDSLDPDHIVDRNSWVAMMKEDMERARSGYRLKRKPKPRTVVKGSNRKKNDTRKYKSKSYAGKRENSRPLDDWDRNRMGYGDDNEDEEDSCTWGPEKNEIRPPTDEYIALKNYYSQRNSSKPPQSFNQIEGVDYKPAKIKTVSRTKKESKALRTVKSLPGLRISKARVIAPSVIENERIENLKIDDEQSNINKHRNAGIWNYPSVGSYCKINRPIRGGSLESFTKYPGQNIPEINSSISLIQDMASASFSQQKRLMYTDLLQANAVRELHSNTQDARCVESMTKRQKELEMAEKVKQKLIKYRLNEEAVRKKMFLNDEDQWNSTVNQMLLMSEKVKEQKNTDPQSSGSRFPRSTSARIVDAVPKKTFNFLNELLQQDEQDQQLFEHDGTYSCLCESKQNEKSFTLENNSDIACAQSSQSSAQMSGSSSHRVTANHSLNRGRPQFMNFELNPPFIRPEGSRAPVSFSGHRNSTSSRVGNRQNSDFGFRVQVKTLANVGNSNRSSSSKYEKPQELEKSVNPTGALRIRPRRYKPMKENNNTSKNPLLNRYSDVFAYYHTPCLRDRVDSSIVQLYDN